MRAKAILIDETGDAEKLRLVDTNIEEVPPGSVLLRQTAIGVNYIDTYHRSGLYPVALPSGIGVEAAGVIEQVGKDVTRWHRGDRVAYALGPVGAYADYRIFPSDRLISLPPEISDEQAAAIVLRGMTAEYLIRRVFPVAQGNVVLFHAAAGGVGQIACQWLKHLGAIVIGTVGNSKKAAVARSIGCDHVINYSEEDFSSRVREITGDRGVDVVFDGVGQTTFARSLDCLARRGMMVSFGNASGPPSPIAPAILAAKGSLFLTRPMLADYIARPEELRRASADLFTVVTSGIVKVAVGGKHALAHAADAHRNLESRTSVGSIVLIP